MQIILPWSWMSFEIFEFWRLRWSFWWPRVVALLRTSNDIWLKIFYSKSLKEVKTHEIWSRSEMYLSVSGARFWVAILSISVWAKEFILISEFLLRLSNLILICLICILSAFCVFIIRWIRPKRSSWLGWFTAYLANVFLIKIQGPILPRQSRDRTKPNS